MLRQRDRRIAGAFHRKLPQPADLFRRQARAGRFERCGIDARSRKQGADIEPLGGKHLRDALHPDGGRRPLVHPSVLRSASYGERVPAEIDPDIHGSVLAMLEGAMARYPDKPAFRCFGQTLSYADTDRLSRNFAAYLQGKLGVAKGDRIAVMLPNIPVFPLAMLGIVRAGAVQVNVNPLYTPRELEHQLNDAGVKTIVIFR